MLDDRRAGAPESKSPSDPRQPRKAPNQAKAPPSTKGPSARPAEPKRATPDWAKPVVPPARVIPPPLGKGGDDAEIDPKMLVGLDQTQAVALLGLPATVEQKPPATVWKYAVEECALDLFFYMEIESRVFRVLTYELITDATTLDPGGACLARIKAGTDGR